ncbi:Uncharacterised protein [Serratia plymuthica]|nr:Uncharacterised protein [Serratia plymuthica]
MFFILTGGYHAFLLTPQLPVNADFGVEMDIHSIFVKHRMFCTAFFQCFMDCRHFFIFMRVTDRRVGAALHHTSPADGN